MYVRDHTRPALKMAMGLDPTQYDYEVFRITSEISKQVFPITLDTDHPKFRHEMDYLHRVADRFYEAKARSGITGLIQQGWYASLGFLSFARLYFIPVKHHELPKQIRLAPIW
jgi:magnesium-protoporphyrin IX monomethyl ester (oxidative) cyclase